MILIAIDPSITCTGVAAMKDGQPIGCAQIKPKAKYQRNGEKFIIPTWQRINQIVEELTGFVSLFTPFDRSPIVVSIEITSGKTAGRFGNQKISGLGTYGMVVGQVARWAISEFGELNVHQFYENDWTRGSKKPRRQEHCRYAYPYYAQKWYEKDKIKTDKHGRYTGGGDVSDAIMLGDYTIQQIATGQIGVRA